MGDRNTDSHLLLLCSVSFLGEFGSVFARNAEDAMSIYLLETRSPKAPSNSYLFSQVVYMIPVAPGVRFSESSQSFGF